MQKIILLDLFDMANAYISNDILSEWLCTRDKEEVLEWLVKKALRILIKPFHEMSAQITPSFSR